MRLGSEEVGVGQNALTGVLILRVLSVVMQSSEGHRRPDFRIGSDLERLAVTAASRYVA